ncbi:hypothetical protein [Shewanella pealeana]|uniref:Uncharacterized protein n=1 Tax=Shewanella pealeana (strain ATCC 700345 / ANG-SQ1) TaxID=398579 RepID=A8H3P1_SHEPA|nr:hypothetical protein [Shewanella pealeana]ABV87178.1 conserved hypothetical protein [Shewanella pealeana ATCC 700345]
MAIEQTEIVALLSELECRTNFSIKKVTEYMLPKLKDPFYLYVDGKQAQLVIRPAYEVFKADLAALEGVNAKEQYCHYSEMTRFPKRVQKSVNGIHYGLAFSFDSADGLKGFIKQLITINQG